MIYDLIIIGFGPAGMSAAIYAARAGLKFLVLEKNYIGGGQMRDTYEVENYPGLPGLTGAQLADAMAAHCEKLGIKPRTAKVLRVEPDRELHRVVTDGELHRAVTDGETYETRNVILAAGASHAPLGIPGEERLRGRGVSYCATCDGAFFKNKDVAVIGGGNLAVEDAIYLAKICRKVYLIHRRDALRAEQILQEQFFALANAQPVWNSNAVRIEGEKRVSGLVVRNRAGEERTLAVSGVFIAVGIVPETALLEGLVRIDEKGYIIAGEDGATSVPGLYVAGDARTKAMRQIVTAVSDGANCIHSILSRKKG